MKPSEFAYCRECAGSNACIDCGTPITPAYTRCYDCQRRYDLRGLPRVSCLLCHEELCSPRLAEVFGDCRKAYLLACMVSHYRHRHVRYYDKRVGSGGKCRDYECFKALVNERAKRQIIRKAKDKLLELGVTPHHFGLLQGTTSQTMELAIRFLRTP